MSDTTEVPKPDPSGDGISGMASHWSMIRAAQGTGPAAEASLRALVERYYPAIQATLRKKGLDAEAAREMTHRFVTRMLDGSFVAAADARRGSFRAFLKTCLSNFARDQWAKTRLRRKAGSLEAAAGRGEEPPAADDLQAEFDRQWARALWKDAVETLRRELQADGRADAWRSFELYHVGRELPPSYRAGAARLGISEAALTNHLHRTRERIRTILRVRLSRETGNADEAAAELGTFVELLQGPFPSANSKSVIK